MAVSNGPDTLTNGLIYCIDPGNRKSYSGSGTTVTDIIGGVSTTLTNGPMYSANVSGNWEFDGSNDYISIDNSTRRFQWTPSGAGSNTLCFELWIKTTDTGGYIISKPWNGNGEYNILLSSSDWTIGNWSFNVTFSSLATGNWEHIVAIATPTQSAVYRNGRLNVAFTNHNLTTISVSGGDSNNVIPLSIMTYYPYGSFAGIPGFSILGNVGLLKIYNVVPSPAEVLQSYNSMKNRFGV